jgi:5-methylcytosine-specific restriction endonuclease McrA
VVPPELRDAVQLRDGFACVYCRRTGCEDGGMVITIDHVIPRYFGGPTSASNLVTACDLCNWMKGVYPLDLWVELAGRLGYGEACEIRARVEAAITAELPRVT